MVVKKQKKKKINNTKASATYKEINLTKRLPARNLLKIQNWSKDNLKLIITKIPVKEDESLFDNSPVNGSYLLM